MTVTLNFKPETCPRMKIIIPMALLVAGAVAFVVLRSYGAHAP
jgi:hypothetical protein